MRFHRPTAIEVLDTILNEDYWEPFKNSRLDFEKFPIVV